MNLRVIKFFFGEALISLRQNMVMSIISVMTISISLILLATFMMLFIDMNSALGNVSRNLNVVAYLDKDITSAGISKVEEQLASIGGIHSFTFVSKDDAWQRLKSKFRYQEDIVTLVVGNPLPDSYIIRLNKIDDIEKITRDLGLIEGVKDVRYGRSMVTKLRKFVQIFNIVAISVVGFLLLATFLITINTINLTILSKRSEVQIMKLVGATNSFIKWSFLIEGFILGIAGALIATIVSSLLFHFVNVKIQDAFPFIGVFTQGLDIMTLDIILLGLGTLIGVAGSFFSIHNLLRGILKK